MKLANTIPTENEALLPRKASPWRGLVVRAAAVSLALGLVASAATGGAKNQPDKYPYWDNLGADWFYGGIWVYRDKYSAGHPNVWKEDKEYKWDE